MACTLHLRSQIVFVFGRDATDHGIAVQHLDSAGTQTSNLGGIVGIDDDLADIEQLQHGHGRFISPMIRLQSKLRVGVDRIEPETLIAVSTHLGTDAGAAAFLIEIEQHAATGGLQQFQSIAQLVAAVAFQRAAEIASQAGRVDADRDRFARIGIADDDRHLILLGEATAKHDEIGVAQIHERYAGARDNRELLTRLVGIGERTPVEGHACRKLRITGIDRRADHRRQKKAQSRKLGRGAHQRAGIVPALWCRRPQPVGKGACFLEGYAIERNADVAVEGQSETGRARRRQQQGMPMAGGRGELIVDLR